MVAKKIIELATTERLATIVFASKKDGLTRLCVNYPRLDTVTMSSLYPPSCMDQCHDRLGEVTELPMLDANSADWQIGIDRRDRDKTALVSHQGLYTFTRISSWVKHTPTSFQRVVDVVIVSISWQLALVHLDDIVAFSKNAVDRTGRGHRELRIMYKVAVTLKLKKRKFSAETIDYLGHVIRPG